MKSIIIWNLNCLPLVSWGLFFLAVRDVLPLSYYNPLHIINIEKQSASSPIGPFPVYILDI